MEKTYLMIKPDAIERKYDILHDILNFITDENLTLLEYSEFTANKKFIDNHYNVHKDKSFYNELVESFYSEDVAGIVICGKDAVKVMRQYVKEVLRAKYGTDKINNAVHSSDSVENALFEIENYKLNK